MNLPVNFTYDTRKYPFRQIVSDFLGSTEGDLPKIHKTHPFKDKLTSAQGDSPDQKTILHRRFYDKMDETPLFKETYDSFINNFLSENLNFDFIYQRFPTFRIHQPSNVGVFAFHKDKEYNHSPHEINIFLPLTKAFDTNTIWKESAEDRGDYTPLESDYGSITLWDGPNCRHGNKTNTTNLSRLSFDFRILPRNHYNPDSQKATVTKSTHLTLGEYFEEIK
jgi:hypothetical protein|tara:strand:+ start:29859 stop:30524 length:666 start_codon:yes stop_codon:yes gene_type:complete